MMYGRCDICGRICEAVFAGTAKAVNTDTEYNLWAFKHHTSNGADQECTSSGQILFSWQVERLVSAPDSIEGVARVLEAEQARYDAEAKLLTSSQTSESPGKEHHQSPSLPPPAENVEPSTLPAKPSSLSEGLGVGPTELRGRKFDDAKDDWSLMPFTALREVLRVLMMGAKKYDRDNWQIVPNAEYRYKNAAMRHLVAMISGEDRDPESGLLHAAHLGCNALFLIWFSLRKSEGRA